MYVTKFKLVIRSLQGTVKSIHRLLRVSTLLKDENPVNVIETSVGPRGRSGGRSNQERRPKSSSQCTL